MTNDQDVNSHEADASPFNRSRETAQRWEYEVLHLKDKPVSPLQLDLLGQDGWELVSAFVVDSTPVPYGGGEFGGSVERTLTFDYYLKRPVSPNDTLIDETLVAEMASYG